MSGKHKEENVYDTLRNLLSKDMGMDQSFVSNIWLQNVHRFYSEDPNKSTIIAKFVMFEDLKSVLNKNSSLRKPGMRVLTDLPVPIKTG